MKMFIHKISNWMGNGFEIKCNGKKMYYYGYAKKEAIKKFRNDFELKYKHLDIVEW